jgi:hypothetical protein
MPSPVRRAADHGVARRQAMPGLGTPASRTCSRNVTANAGFGRPPWDASWDHKPAQPSKTRDLRETSKDICPHKEAGTNGPGYF